MIFSCSTTEPGQPCVTMTGSAFSCFERTWMKWMSSPSISVMNCGSAFSLRLALAPVVFGRPIARELLHRRELHALRCIRDRFPLRPLRRVDAPAQLGELRFRNIHMKRTNCACMSVDCLLRVALVLVMVLSLKRLAQSAASFVTSNRAVI